MKLDVRFPMGVMFVILGSLLVFYGDPEGVHTKGDDFLIRHINVIWGVVLCLFGLFALFLTRRGGGE